MSRRKSGVGSGGTGAERSEVEVTPELRRRPGRRTADERTGAVLDLLAGKATVDQLARRFGVQSSTVERWREAALASIASSMRQGTGRTARESELERDLKSLERAFTDLAIKYELRERALKNRPTRPGR